MKDAGKCQGDLGVNWAPAACINAVQNAGNQNLVRALGDEACSRARLSTGDPAAGEASCEEARALAEKAAWVEIERSAVNGRQPNLDLDQLVSGLPKAPPAATLKSQPASDTFAPQDRVSASKKSILVALPASAPTNTLIVTQNSTANAEAEPPSSEAMQSASVVPIGSLEYLDSRDGFRDLRFGQAPTPSMILIENDGDTKFYGRRSDDMTAGAGKLSDITYGFYRNQLFTVMLTSRGITNSDALLETLRSAYGPGDQTNEFIERYFWRGSLVTVIYDENSITHDARASLNSVQIAQAKKADENSAAMKSGSNF